MFLSEEVNTHQQEQLTSAGSVYSSEKDVPPASIIHPETSISSSPLLHSSSHSLLPSAPEGSINTSLINTSALTLLTKPKNTIGSINMFRFLTTLDSSIQSELYIYTLILNVYSFFMDAKFATHLLFVCQ